MRWEEERGRGGRRLRKLVAEGSTWSEELSVISANAVQCGTPWDHCVIRHMFIRCAVWTGRRGAERDLLMCLWIRLWLWLWFPLFVRTCWVPCGLCF